MEATIYINPERDHFTTVENGLRVAHPIAATEAEQDAAEAQALRRELDGVEYRLEHLDDDPPSFVVEVPNRETVERTRTSLVNTRAAILGRLEQLGAIETTTTKRGKR